jgi:hypothetical protein
LVTDCDLHGKLGCDMGLCRSRSSSTHPHFHSREYAPHHHSGNETYRQWLPGVQENPSRSLVVRAPSPRDEFDRLYTPRTIPANQHHFRFSDEAHSPVYAVRPWVHRSSSRPHQEFSYYEEFASRPRNRNHFRKGSEYEASAQHSQGNFIHVYPLSTRGYEETDEACWSRDHTYEHGRVYGEESAHTSRPDHAKGYYSSTSCAWRPLGYELERIKAKR